MPVRLLRRLTGASLRAALWVAARGKKGSLPPQTLPSSKEKRSGGGMAGGFPFRLVLLLERIRIEIVFNFNADAALTLRKKRGFSVCSVAGSRSRDYQSNPHFQCGIALMILRAAFCLLPHTARLSSSSLGFHFFLILHLSGMICYILSFFPKGARMPPSFSGAERLSFLFIFIFSSGSLV